MGCCSLKTADAHFIVTTFPNSAHLIVFSIPRPQWPVTRRPMVADLPSACCWPSVSLHQDPATIDLLQAQRPCPPVPDLGNAAAHNKGAGPRRAGQGRGPRSTVGTLTEAVDELIRRFVAAATDYRFITFRFADACAPTCRYSAATARRGVRHLNINDCVTTDRLGWAEANKQAGLAEPQATPGARTVVGATAYPRYDEDNEVTLVIGRADRQH